MHIPPCKRSHRQPRLMIGEAAALNKLFSVNIISKFPIIFFRFSFHDISRRSRNSCLCFVSVQSSNEDHSLWPAACCQLNSSLPTISRGLSQSSQRLFHDSWFLPAWNNTKGWFVCAFPHSSWLARRKSWIDSWQRLPLFTLRYDRKNVFNYIS